jgi:hypothetical protein|tara:strand:- start:261 stop:452 length:192 start_codon:yes stop_codon:yes gene_type:complete
MISPLLGSSNLKVVSISKQLFKIEHGSTSLMSSGANDLQSGGILSALNGLGIVGESSEAEKIQ